MTTYDDLVARAAAIDDRVARLRRASEQGAAARITRPLGGGLGHVTVDGHGVLVAVELDHDRVGTTGVVALGRQVVDAVHAAESAACRARRDAVDAVGGEAFARDQS